jgi:hypothetical protein
MTELFRALPYYSVHFVCLVERIGQEPVYVLNIGQFAVYVYLTEMENISRGPSFGDFVTSS